MSKNFLITGACRGIGRGLSRLLLSKGHRVFLVDVNDVEIEHMRSQIPKWMGAPAPAPAPAPATAATAATAATMTTIKTETGNKSQQSQWQIFKADLCNREEIELAADSAAVFFDGHLDTLICNAAYTDGVLHDTKIDSDSFPELWTRSLAVNLTGSMLLTRACLPLLRRNPRKGRRFGGSIIFMSSTRAYQSEVNSESYATTKAGILGLSQSLSCSLASSGGDAGDGDGDGDGIKVNSILPGWINVAHECKEGDDKGWDWKTGLTEDDHGWHFSGRVGKVEDILRAVEFLAQTDADGDGLMTGQEIVVDGGVTRRMVYPE